MMRRGLCLLLSALGLLLPLAVLAQPQPPAIAARAYVLLDLTSDQELASKAPDDVIQPTSLSSLMTAYLVFDALRLGRLELGQAVPVSPQAAAQPGPRMFLQAGMKVPVEDLLKGMLVQTANDAALTLAEAVAGSEAPFVRLMNEQAQALGMTATRFVHAAGLPAQGQQTTARDLATLARALLRDFPRQAPFFGIRKYHYAGTPAANENNRNVLLFRDPSVIGLQVGQGEAGSGALVAAASRPLPPLGPAEAPGARRLVAVVLGADGESARATEAQKLLNWGYTAFETVRLFEAHQPIVAPPVWKGAATTALLGRPQPVFVTVPSGSASALRVQVTRREPLVAPLRKGQAVGTLQIYVGERKLSELPLIVLEPVDSAGLLGRAWDAIRLWAP